MNNMKLEDLIGYKLCDIDDKYIIVTNGEHYYALELNQYEGDCCGYNELETKLLIDSKNSPIITNIVREESTSDLEECDKCEITFYGLDKELAKINSISGSESGWCYGACVTVECKRLDMKDTITSW